mgnify:CR=1 FL=1
MEKFMENLLSDINNYEKLKNSSDEFIKHHTLKKITTYKNMISSKLPINTIFGSTYLIKNNNIIHFYSFYDSDYSPHIEVNLRVKRWMCITDIINKENNDPENLSDLEKYYDIIGDSQLTELLIIEYINKGFDLYI